MLTTIIFGLALLFSYTTISGTIFLMIRRRDEDNGDLIARYSFAIASILLWSYLFYLLH